MVVEMIISVILLFGGIAVLIIIHICVVGRAFREDPINGRRNSFPARAERIPAMNPEDIKGLPCLEYNANGNTECAVCLEIFRAGDKCRILPKCNHTFHADCIDSWLLNTAACPICRTGAKSPQAGQSTSSCSGEV